VSGDGPLTLAGAAANGVRDGAYRGTLEFRATAVGTLLVVDAVGLESYVRGVVGGEMPGSWPAEALEAQAVAARTYAITTGGNGADFDQYADTRSQMYRGVAAESPATDAAVAATSGQVVTYQGRPVATFFFSTSGGRTEDVQNSFLGSPPRPWLVSVADPYDDLSPKHRWGPFRMTLAQAGRKLRGLVKGSFRRISVVERGTSPRIVYADVVGTRGRTRVTGATLRARFGLFDTWATFTTITASGKATPDPDAAAPVSDAPPSDPQTGGVQPGGTTTSHTGGSARAAAYRLAGSVVGIVAPVRRRAHVRLERRAAGAWHPLAWLRPSRSGRYSFRGLRPGAYRVVWRGDTGPVVRL
jgi:stage II sporulation protein D